VLLITNTPHSVTMPALQQRSSEADHLYNGAMRFVDEVSRKQWGGFLPAADQADLARRFIATNAHRLMLEELAPIHSKLAQIAALSLGPTPPIPADVQAYIDSIRSRWQGAVQELCS
jgi:hypothetical protein